MTATISDRIVTAHEDAERLLSWAEPNWIALEDERVDALVQRALRCSVPDELRGDALDDPAACQPLLRFANADAPDLPLLDALIDDKHLDAHTCDLCSGSQRSVNRLVVPCGQSAVALHFCWRCQLDFETIFRPSTLVWG